MLLTDICRFVQLILLLSHFQSAPRVFLWDDKHWVASLHIFRRVQSPNQKIPDRKTKCVIKTHINIKQNVIFGAKLKPV